MKQALLFSLFLLLAACTAVPGKEEKQPMVAPTATTTPAQSVPTITTTAFADENMAVQFSHPTAWKLVAEDEKTLDLKGKTMALTTTFNDETKHTNFSIIRHLNPYGKILFQGVKDDFNKLKKGKEVEFAGLKGYQTESEMKVNGRGKKLDNPTKKIVLHLLTPNKEDIEIQFSTTINENELEEVKKFQSVVNSLKLID